MPRTRRVAGETVPELTSGELGQAAGGIAVSCGTTLTAPCRASISPAAAVPCVAHSVNAAGTPCRTTLTP